jgi:hypothetical protein
MYPQLRAISYRVAPIAILYNINVAGRCLIIITDIELGPAIGDKELYE